MSIRGSEWRRWDLHTHTPDTAINNQFASWDEYLDAIEADGGNVVVIGPTDYYLLENYSKLKQYKDAGRIPEAQLLIPNLEFRIAPPTERATAVNIHLLVSPDDPEHEQLIQDSLARLSWEYNGNQFSCTRRGLISLGKRFDPTIEDDAKALEMGATQFKVDFSAFKKWYESEKWLCKNSIVVVDAGDDGLSGFLNDGGWAAHREEITRFSQALFSGRPGEINFWLCKKSDADRETVNRLGGPKPCLKGSDAHRIEQLFNPDQDRYCWIKADPTFEGLRQVLYEPGERVHIGPTPPLYHDKSRVIDAVSLSNSSGWFEDIEIPLNPSLVSIIGQKGSGKSALAEIIAHTANSWPDDDQSSFLNRAGDYLRDMDVELVWADGVRTPLKVGDPQVLEQENLVRYLSQKFVERLCSEDTAGSELINEIENVIYSFIDPTETLDASSFKELRKLRTEGLSAERDKIQLRIQSLIEEYCELRRIASLAPSKKRDIQTLEKEKAGLLAQMPTGVSKQDKENLASLQANHSEMNKLQDRIGKLKKLKQQIQDIRRKITGFRGEIDRFNSELVKNLEAVGISGEQLGGYLVAFQGDTETPLAQQEAKIDQTISKLTGDKSQPNPGTLLYIRAEIEKLTKINEADKARQTKIIQIQKRIAEIDSTIERLNSELKKISEGDAERTEQVRTSRDSEYQTYFENLVNEQQILSELYEPVSERLQSQEAFPQEQSLEFIVQWQVDINRWLNAGRELFDGRSPNPHGSFDDLSNAAKSLLLKAWMSGDPASVLPALNDFLEPFHAQAPNSYLKKGVTVSQLHEWLYSTDHICLSYGLKYNGVDLQKLSPGTKGIVLLILYLGMDTEDTRPLIVDQPDENLDNESIYKILTTYFRLAKQRRQIILITHNPNLVVNGDSEQVVVACCGRQENGLPLIKYQTGSMENNAIKKHVCTILEGGADAFTKRESRYSLGIT